MTTADMPLPAPRVAPALDPQFRPAVLAHHAFRAAAHASGHAVPILLALEQTDGSVSHHATQIFPTDQGVGHDLSDAGEVRPD